MISLYNESIKIKKGIIKVENMIVYDTLNKLAYELKNSDEYIQYKKLKEEIKNNLELQQKLENFEKARYEIQLAKIQQKEIQEELDDKTVEMQKIYVELIQNETMKKYFDAELKFNIMLSDVNKIISEAVEDVIKL